MVEVAQLVEHQIVTLGVAGSIPVFHPICPVNSEGRVPSLQVGSSAVRTRHRAPFYGGLPKRLKGSVLKTERSVMSRCVGSNPTSSAIWRVKHNWHCLGLENRSCESMWEFESLTLRQIEAGVR